MRRTVLALQLPLAIMVWAGCARSPKQASFSADRAGSTGLARMDAMIAAPSSAAYPMAAGRWMAASPEADRSIAVRHKLTVLSAESDLPKIWEALITFCSAIRCEVISSSIVTRTQESAPSGAIVIRVVPEDFPKLLTQVEKQGNIVEHTTLSEDKTTQVVDTEARLKNLTSYRDSLRAMLGRPGLNIKDSVEIQEKLTDVQSDLDSETAKRKILANETEKVAVEIEFRVRDASRRRSAFAPLWASLREAGETLAESLGSVITFVVFIIPWILLFLLIGWLLRRLWRKRRGKKAALAAAQTGS
jgi:hypothetical protein